MYELEVKASESYKITISSDLGGLSSAVTGDKVAIITDSNVNKLYGSALDGVLSGKTVYKYVIVAGEQSKNKNTYFDLLEFLSADGFGRTDTVIAFGGGVVGDLGGFVASTYMRGVTLVQVPTTILAAVDSSVGGKTAINLSHGKNLVGSFYQPKAVYINTEFFKTLPEREIMSGMGEIIKYAFLNKSVSARMIEEGVSERLVYECLKIKRDIVQKDERESGERALLNLGHTVGHAIESLSEYSYSHGECVVKGLAFTLKISKELYNTESGKYAEMLKLLNSCGHDLSCPFSAKELIKQIAYDKKGDGKAVKFVALKSIGEPEIVKLSYEELEKYLG